MTESGKASLWVLAWIAAAGAGLAGLIGIGCAIGANACPFGDDGGIRATTGREIYIEAVCIGCHGPGGAGTETAPSLISGSAAGLSLEQLVNKIGRGSPGLMPRFKNSMTAEQIEAVAGYVIELREAS